MAPKRATRSNTAPETTNTTSVTNAQLQAVIDQGVTDALAARDADKNTNGDDNHNSGMVENQVKFATCTLHSVSLTWWNTHVKTVGHDATYGMPWKTLMKMITDKYYPRNEIKKREIKIWDMKVDRVMTDKLYQRFQGIGFVCEKDFPEESYKIERYVGGLPNMIHRSVVASNPKTMQEAIEMATELMNTKIRTFEGVCWNSTICATSARLHHYGQYRLWESKGTTRSDCPELMNQNLENQAKGRRHVELYVGPSKVMEKVGSVAYKLELPQELSSVHHTFHVSNLKKCYTDEPLSVTFNGFHIEDKLYFIEESKG
ncbi:hypothetical protein Tco_0878922 [Tanacetum coccineum]|uniref:Reverse transcriptase domain-containing protein n=1 Tax=Tanacetum coccineum TaxID=301880 RepID=A0ABQ5BZN4_9ASTR